MSKVLTAFFLTTLTGMLLAAPVINSLYPDVKAEDIPDTVFEDIAKGMTLVEAYQKQLIADEKAKANIDAQNKKNAEKSMGSARTAQSENSDPFLSEFLKE